MGISIKQNLILKKETINHLLLLHLKTNGEKQKIIIMIIIMIIIIFDSSKQYLICVTY